MKQILSFRFLFIFLLVFVAGLTAYWQQTTTLFTAASLTETPDAAVFEEPNPPQVAQDLASVTTPLLKKEHASTQLPQRKKEVTPLTESTKIVEADEAIKEAAERKSVGDRWAVEFEMIKNPITGKIPKGIHQKGIGAAKKVRALQLPPELSEDGLSVRTLPTITTTVRGPNNYGGRTRAIAFDKRSTQIMLTGGVSSGIFRSTNGGGNWVRVTPAGEIHTVTAIAQDPRVGQGDTWYFGTGESNNSAGGTGAAYLGHGIWKSTDNGLNWTALTNTQGNLYAYDNDFDNINRIIINPIDGA